MNDNLTAEKRLARKIINSPEWLEALEARMRLAVRTVKRGRIYFWLGEHGWLARFEGVAGLPSDVALPLAFTARASLNTVASYLVGRYPDANIYCPHG